MRFYICRNKDGKLIMFSSAPFRKLDYWDSLDCGGCIPNTMFTSLRWEDDPLIVSIRKANNTPYYVARDKDYDLWLFFNRPSKRKCSNDWVVKDDFVFMLPSTMFKYVKWESEPINVDIKVLNKK